ncbi:general amino acid permease AGP2-like protein 4 [Cladorrhinum samala]|uniref:General amino acid permease AGP2-like protein 4 n=1 Tax=Cladorrhinum samala TaxID=585594 RepID=A0AAV9I4W9_9PEZI|nr:general amino acid permease AGP2-like protein 4 [Cladorrhinum samala]
MTLSTSPAGLDVPTVVSNMSTPGGFPEDKEKGTPEASSRSQSFETGSMSNASVDHTHRRLKPRHIQLIGIGGSISTALYVQIGQGLLDGGPGNLLVAFIIWCTFILAVTISMAEMVTYLPISSPFIRLAGRWVDEAYGFATGWNFFIFQAALIPFEIVACTVILHYWTDAIPAGAVIAIIIVCYAAINFLAVSAFGEVEFFTALFKVILIVALIFFTLFAMLGLNPQHDRFGFRYWNDPGAFAEFYSSGSFGRFLGFLQCLIQASFTIGGPEYVAMAAGEAGNPRSVMPKAFNAVFYRLTTFYVLGSLAVGILVPYTDQELRTAFDVGSPGAAASPYVVAMRRLGVRVLPDIVNGMVFTSAFSAGNSYVYCASRSLYGLALEGKAPKIFTRCTKHGIPIYAVMLVLLISLLSFLQVSNSAGVVLNWFVKLVTVSQLMNFGVVCFTYLRFYKGLKAQGIDRKTLPYRGLFQPYAAWYGLIGTTIMSFLGGYNVFLDGKWNVPDFIFSYTMIAVFPLLIFGYKIINKTKFRSPEEMDLVKNLEEIEEHQKNFVPIPPRNLIEKVLDRVFA